MMKHPTDLVNKTQTNKPVTPGGKVYSCLSLLYVKHSVSTRRGKFCLCGKPSLYDGLENFPKILF